MVADVPESEADHNLSDLMAQQPWNVLMPDSAVLAGNSLQVAQDLLMSLEIHMSY